MRKRSMKKSNLERINIMIDKELLKKIDDFISDPGLKRDKINRSLFFRDIIDYIFNDFGKKGKKSILEYLYPEE